MATFRMANSQLASLASVIGNVLAVYRSSWPALLITAPVLLLWSTAALACAAWVKRTGGGRTGYSRKLFHLLIFASAGASHLLGGLPLVCILGMATTVVLAYAVIRGSGHPFYEALARESDAPYRTYYIVTSYLATLAGGLLSNALAGHVAFIGYLVCGFGDAAGEPVGTRLGRHWYRVPGGRGGAFCRSLEGSAGVFAVSLLALCVGVGTVCGAARTLQLTPELAAVALACTLTEAVSPHGWDNATMQLVPTLLVAAWFGQRML